MNVWCAECYSKIKNSLTKVYGDYLLENVDMITELSEKGITQVIYYPSLKVRVPVKTKKGLSKNKTIIVKPFAISYCPFCGKPIQNNGDKVEE